jgi:hypothetical protein
MAGEPPENNSIKGAPGSRRKRPAEFAPAGRRGDDAITRNLKRVYEQVAAEPVPPDLMKLLDQLGDRNGEDDDV